MASSVHIWIIYGLVSSYALCFQLQRPIEPFLVDKLVSGGKEEAAVAFGRVEAFFSIAQGFGSLAMGYILDRCGMRVGLIVNFLACAAQYFILSMTDSLTMLFLSKVPGMLMGGFLCAQTAVAKVTEDGPERLKALGRLTTAYTIGGITGPYIGGVLGSSGDYFLGARLATAGSLLAAGLVLLLPAGLDRGVEKKVSDSVEESSSMPWLGRAALVLRTVGLLLSVKVVTGIANNMARSAQPLILKNDLGFDEAMMGKVMSGQFAFGGFANAFLLAPMTAALGGEITSVVRNCVIVMGAAYMLEAALFAPSAELLAAGSQASGGVYVMIALFLSTFQFTLATSITAGTQGMVQKTMLGTLMGIEHSIFAVAGMIGPLIGTYIFKLSGISGLALACGSVFAAILALWLLAFQPPAGKAKNT